MPLELIRIREDSPLLPEVTKLYLSAFPANERRPLKVLLADQSDASEVMAVCDDGCFVGLVILLTWRDITHIIYFAVIDALRERGYGSHILQMVQETHPGQRIIADVEAPNNDADNNLQRERRIAFYERNGFLPTEIRYTWRQENYIIVAANGMVSEEEFEAFWTYFYTEKDGFDY